jgi:hypothetical protein
VSPGRLRAETGKVVIEFDHGAPGEVLVWTMNCEESEAFLERLTWAVRVARGEPIPFDVMRRLQDETPTKWREPT